MKAQREKVRHGRHKEQKRGRAHSWVTGRTEVDCNHERAARDMCWGAL